ncbi:ribosome biogenesis protein SLX9-domain-containing protein [Diplogelasinospora grovesii]|uniref:Ribosome biogenesis protein SLX9 n=1 Tax=Diplogelasinospora grovesii TaxID=303347 RepID=A0AAN6NAD9_9PEZI|nr:ribosome biogenesis protein SLX9-domain-containing protein [Diplogelasinospora grovesii]
MAPTAPKKRVTARQKAARAASSSTSKPSSTTTTIPRSLDTATDDFGLAESKRDKLKIKHTSFVSKITKARSANKITKRRRPSKKLVTTLESLEDALGDIQEQIATEDAEQLANGQPGKVKHRSLKTRPGALKRKEKLVRTEMERFNKSLAQLSSIPPQQTQNQPSTVAPDVKMDTEETTEKKEEEAAPSATTSRWAALRGFISATMEQNPAFLNKT